MERRTGWIVLASTCLGAMSLAGCGGTKILTVMQQNADGNSEIWVCPGGKAEGCRGEREGDIDPAGYQHRLYVVSPPKECVNGTATLDIVIKGNDVERVRYECAQPPEPTGLPPSVSSPAAGGPAGAGTGLPPSTDSPSGANGTGLPPSTEAGAPAASGLPPSTGEADSPSQEKP